jgi:uncharacterized protein
MQITPTLIAEHPLQLNQSIPEGTIDYAPDVRQIGPLELNGRAELIVEHRGPKEFVEDIRLRAHFKGRFEQLCARCITPVEQPLEGDFDLLFRPAGADAIAGEHAITEDETEIGYYEKSGLSLEDSVREQVLLALPTRTLCRPDCQGLCPHCGADRNSAPCNCDDRPADPRWTALSAIAVDKQP